MFLYVFTFLLLAIVGLYTQIFAMQSSQMSAKQKGVAEIMSRWHDEAYRVAKTNLVTLLSAASPCFLSKEEEAVPGTCGSLTITSDPLAGLTDQMKFNSVVYRVGTESYLVTYVVDIAGYAKAGFKSSEIFRQMRMANFDGRMFGQVTSAACNGVTPSFMTTTKLNNVTVCYPVGATASIPNGAVGFISAL